MVFLKLFFPNLYRKMPRALSDVWRHFTAAHVEGKAVYICSEAVIENKNLFLTDLPG